MDRISDNHSRWLISMWQTNVNLQSKWTVLPRRLCQGFLLLYFIFTSIFCDFFIKIFIFPIYNTTDLLNTILVSSQFVCYLMQLLTVAGKNLGLELLIAAWAVTHGMAPCRDMRHLASPAAFVRFWAFHLNSKNNSYIKFWQHKLFAQLCTLDFGPLAFEAVAARPLNRPRITFLILAYRR